MPLALLLAATLMQNETPEPLAAYLERIRAKAGLPSICAGAIVDGKIVALEAVGVRRLGSDERVTVDDPYHCGSITKSFTAALFARFVQEGKAAWDVPLVNLFPDLAPTMDPAFARVTPLDLMAHRSGLSSASWPKEGVDTLVRWRGEGPSPRSDYVRLMLKEPPSYPPESRFEYSNANYVVLAAILEGLGHANWELLLTSRLLRPLGLKSAGFGPVGREGRPKGPWGHAVRDGRLTPVPPEPWGDNPETLGPSATLHMSVPDLLRWGAFQCDEGRSGGPLEPAAFETLHHAPFGGDYAGGLIAAERGWGGGLCFNHAGSNTYNDENLWIAPRKRFALVVATNAMAPGVEDAVERVTAEMIRRYGTVQRAAKYARSGFPSGAYAST